MHRPTMAVSVLVAIVVAVPLPAQQVRLPEYTDQQRWERAAFLLVGWEAALVAFGAEHGLTPEQTGEWIGEFFSDSWLNGQDARQHLVSLFRNHSSMPTATAEVTSSTPTTVTARFNRPSDDLIGPAGYLGVDREAVNAMLQAVNTTIAAHVGVGYEVESTADGDIIRLETQYVDAFDAGNQMRWNRSSYLSWLTFLQFFQRRKADGLTATEIGQQDAELYAPTWSASTPWRLLRGMIWNQMIDPASECEVLSASPDEVRASCVMHYIDIVESNESRFGVTVDDVFQTSRAFAEGVAEYLGMQWEETRDGNTRLITITRR